MELLLVRHGIAFERDPVQWPDDRERPLTARGERRFREAARGLRNLVPGPDLVLSSPLTRAWQTAVILREELGWPDPVRFEPLEPGGAPHEIVTALSSHTSAGRITIVGHEPNLSHLATFLLTNADQEIGLTMKKGGVVCLRFAGSIAGGDAELRWWVTPKILRSLAR